MRTVLTLWLLVLAAGFAGCVSSLVVTSPDAGLDGGDDGSSGDAGADGGDDAGTDAGLDAGGDAGTDGGGRDAGPDGGGLQRIFIVHVQPVTDAHWTALQVEGYFRNYVILWDQWGPGFVNVATGAVWNDMITNNEFPGIGRYPVGPLLDHHGCCNTMAIHGDQLYVLNNGAGELNWPGNVVVYNIDPPAFVRAYESDGGNEWAGGLGSQLTDPNGFTWSIRAENVLWTPSFREDVYLWRSDYDGG